VTSTRPNAAQSSATSLQQRAADWLSEPPLRFTRKSAGRRSLEQLHGQTAHALLLEIDRRMAGLHTRRASAPI